MPLSLYEIDPTYANVVHHMSVAERISYCEALIDRTQSFVTRNNKYMDQGAEEKYLAIIAAAQSELKNLICGSS